MRTVAYPGISAQSPSSQTNSYPLGGNRGGPDRRVLARYLRKHPTLAETSLWTLVRRQQLGLRFRRQAPVLSYVADLYVPAIMLVVEVDGPAHHGSDSRARARRTWDRARDAHLRRFGFHVVRFSNDAVLSHAGHVLQKLRRIIAARRLSLGSETRFSVRSLAHSGD